MTLYGITTKEDVSTPRAEKCNKAVSENTHNVRIDAEFVPLFLPCCALSPTPPFEASQ